MMYFSSLHDLRANPEDQQIYEEISDEFKASLKTQDYEEADGSMGERVAVCLRFWSPYDALDECKKCNARYTNQHKTLWLEYFLATVDYTPLNHEEFRKKLSSDIMPHFHDSLHKYKKKGRLDTLDVEQFMINLKHKLQTFGPGWEW